jgi:hypothetical protein
MSVVDNLRKICACARGPLEAMLDAAEELAEIRGAASEQGLDWSQVKALLKAQIQDERDGGHRVEKLVAKADNASTYAAMLNIVAENKKTSPQSEPAVPSFSLPAHPPAGRRNLAGGQQSSSHFYSGDASAGDGSSGKSGEPALNRPSGAGSPISFAPDYNDDIRQHPLLSRVR